MWGWGSGTPLTRDILFVDEDSNRLHRFNREELVAEITAMAVEHGFDAGTTKAVMGG